MPVFGPYSQGRPTFLGTETRARQFKQTRASANHAISSVLCDSARDFHSDQIYCHFVTHVGQMCGFHVMMSIFYSGRCPCLPKGICIMMQISKIGIRGIKISQSLFPASTIWILVQCSLLSASILMHSDSVFSFTTFAWLWCNLIQLPFCSSSAPVVFKIYRLLFPTLFGLCRSGLPFVQEFLSFCVQIAALLYFRPLCIVRAPTLHRLVYCFARLWWRFFRLAD